MQALVVDSNSEDYEIISSSMKVAWPNISIALSTKGDKALEAIEEEPFDIVIIDLMLPDMSGFEFLKSLFLFKDIPVIALKNGLQVSDTVRCLEIGVGDCLNKPLEQIEFIARAKALVRRCHRNEEEDSLISGLLRLDYMIHKLYLRDTEINLTRAENQILRHLMRNCGRITSYQSISRDLWGEDYCGANKAIRVHVDRIRRKLQIYPDAPLIINERGIGIRLVLSN